MKVIALLLLCVTVVLAQTNECPPPTCQTVGTRDGCPTGSVCRDVKRPEDTTSNLRCICEDLTKKKCTTIENSVVMTCDATPTTFCGGRTTPCPEGTYCASLPSGEKACRCSNIYAVFDTTQQKCIIRCPENMQPTATSCTCKPGYVRSCGSTDPNTENCPCVPDDRTTCANVVCASPYVCSETAEGPRCIPSTTDRTYCGVNFRCPSDHFKCVDTDLGAKCICAERWGHFPGCDRPKCYQLENENTTSEYGCWNTPNAVCIIDQSNDVSADRIGYCQCKDGFRGDDCNTNDNLCVNVQCPVANTRCREGRCVCGEGYIATVETLENGVSTIVKCELKTPPTCDNTRCASNLVCVARTAGPECVCPSDTFGSAECNKPRCASDADCSFLANAYCVLNTREAVAGYCACKPGFTGERCEVRHTCTAADCGTNTRCDNEGVCRCDAGREGTNCNNDDSETICVKVTLITRNKLTEDELRAKLAEFVRADVVNFKVVEGPTERSNGEPGYRYLILVCRDANIDEKKTGDDLVNRAGTSEGESAGFITAAAGDVDDPAGSGVAVTTASAAVICGAVLAAL